MQTGHGLVVDGKTLNMSIDSTLNIKHQNNSIDEPRVKDPLLDDSLDEVQVEHLKLLQKQDANQDLILA